MPPRQGLFHARLLALAQPAAAETVGEAIAKQCLERWGNDYAMRDFCERRQLDAARRLKERGLAPEWNPETQRHAATWSAAAEAACTKHYAGHPRALGECLVRLGR
jgi:hypothetical protein